MPQEALGYQGMQLRFFTVALDVCWWFCRMLWRRTLPSRSWWGVLSSLRTLPTATQPVTGSWEDRLTTILSNGWRRSLNLLRTTMLHFSPSPTTSCWTALSMHSPSTDVRLTLPFLSTPRLLQVSSPHPSSPSTTSVARRPTSLPRYLVPLRSSRVVAASSDWSPPLLEALELSVPLSTTMLQAQSAPLLVLLLVPRVTTLQV